MECKPASTLVEVNLHKLKEDMIESKSTDPTYYRQINGSLMY